MMSDDDDADDEERWRMNHVDSFFAFYISSLWSAIFYIVYEY